MELSHRIEDHICIIRIEGVLSLERVNKFRKYLQPLLNDQEIQSLILNFKHVPDIDSSGISVLISVFKTFRKQQFETDANQTFLKKFVLCEVNEKCDYVFKLVKLDKILKIYPTELNALNDLTHKEKQVSHRQEEGICVVSIAEDMLGSGTFTVKSFIEPFIHQANLQVIVLNFEKMNWIDSAGIGFIMSIFRIFEQRKIDKDSHGPTELVLCHLNEHCTKIFDMLRLNTILKVYATEEEAMSALKEPSTAS